MQIAESQCHFLHLLIKTSNVKKILEIMCEYAGDTLVQNATNDKLIEVPIAYHYLK